MRLIGLVLVALLTLDTSSFAGDAGLERMLRRLDLETRFEQLCAIEAMRRIDRAKNSFHPDRADVGAISEPVADTQLMKGSGGAFRSGGHWYRFSFSCRASADRLKVLDFKYTIGAKIPEDEWENYGLWK
jgi:hypothetical protein